MHEQSSALDLMYSQIIRLSMLLSSKTNNNVQSWNKFYFLEGFEVKFILKQFYRGQLYGHFGGCGFEARFSAGLLCWTALVLVG